jgi:hypothetical protein
MDWRRVLKETVGSRSYWQKVAIISGVILAVRIIMLLV